MLLQASYPNYYNSLTNQFFQSSIKRRLAMLTKKQTQRISYAGRLLALPIMAFIVFAFTIKTKNANNQGAEAMLENNITVVIDAGHGGNTGAKASGVIEDEIVLQIAKQIEQLNTNSKIKILLTRENDQLLALKDRVQFAKEKNADLFISLHANAEEQMIETVNGIEVLVPSKNPTYQKNSELIGSALVKELSEVYMVQPNLGKSKSGVWVLDENVCASVLIECGYLTNKKDREFISNRSNQKLIAQKILSAITNYAANTSSQDRTGIKENEKTGTGQASGALGNLNKDTLDNPLVYIDGIEKGRLKSLGGWEKVENTEDIKSINVFKGQYAIDKFGAKGSEGVINILTSKSVVPPPPPPPAPLDGGIVISTGKENPLIYIDGKESGKLKDGKMNQLDQNNIESINVLKGESAVKAYGEKAKDGVIEIKMKENKSGKVNNSDSNRIFTVAETPAAFPGGKEAWGRFLQKTLNANVPIDKGASEGSYEVIIKFVVTQNGALENIEPETKHGYGMEDEAIRILKSGPKWTPAIQNGRNVASYVKQKITFVIVAQ
jgi:N-acetylmuramoyl-L-alanine amidase